MCKDAFNRLLNLATYYLDKDNETNYNKEEKKSKSKKLEEFSAPNIEDAITKIVKLLANLSTEETYAMSTF